MQNYITYILFLHCQLFLFSFIVFTFFCLAWVCLAWYYSLPNITKRYRNIKYTSDYITIFYSWWYRIYILCWRKCLTRISRFATHIPLKTVSPFATKTSHYVTCCNHSERYGIKVSTVLEKYYILILNSIVLCFKCNVWGLKTIRIIS